MLNDKQQIAFVTVKPLKDSSVTPYYHKWEFTIRNLTDEAIKEPITISFEHTKNQSSYEKIEDDFTISSDKENIVTGILNLNIGAKETKTFHVGFDTTKATDNPVLSNHFKVNGQPADLPQVTGLMAKTADINIVWNKIEEAGVKFKVTVGGKDPVITAENSISIKDLLIPTEKVGAEIIVQAFIQDVYSDASTLHIMQCTGDGSGYALDFS